MTATTANDCVAMAANGNYKE